MDNPYAERQTILLQRIHKNVDKCTEIMQELNHCVEEVLRANAFIQLAADLQTQHRKNIQYNLSLGTGDVSHSTSER